MVPDVYSFCPKESGADTSRPTFTYFTGEAECKGESGSHHLAKDHKGTNFEPGITEDPKNIADKVYVSGTKATTDRAVNYILRDYERTVVYFDRHATDFEIGIFAVLPDRSDAVESNHDNVDTCEVTHDVSCHRTDETDTDGHCRDAVYEAFADPRNDARVCTCVDHDDSPPSVEIEEFVSTADVPDVHHGRDNYYKTVVSV